MNSGGLLLDFSSSGVMLGIGLITWFLEWSKLERPDSLLDDLEEIRVLLASPECVDDVLDTDAAVLAQ